jgi:hypothetical protein
MVSHGLAAIDGIGADEAEIDDVARLGGRARQPVGRRLVFFRRERFGIDFLEDYFSV